GTRGTGIYGIDGRLRVPRRPPRGNPAYGLAGHDSCTRIELLGAITLKSSWTPTFSRWSHGHQVHGHPGERVRRERPKPRSARIRCERVSNQVGRADERESRKRQQGRELDAGSAIAVVRRRLRDRPKSERRHLATREIEHWVGRRLPRRPKGGEAIPATRRYTRGLVPAARRPPRPGE